MSEAKSGRLPEALPILEKAFKNPADYEWRQQTGLLLIEIYSARMELDKALDILRTLQKSYPSSPEVLYMASPIHSESGATAVSGLVRADPAAARLQQVTAALLGSEGACPRTSEQ